MFTSLLLRVLDASLFQCSVGKTVQGPGGEFFTLAHPLARGFLLGPKGAPGMGPALSRCGIGLQKVQTLGQGRVRVGLSHRAPALFGPTAGEPPG